jgi:23S rRNA pseudouridine2605 synthase
MKSKSEKTGAQHSKPARPKTAPKTGSKATKPRSKSTPPAAIKARPRAAKAKYAAEEEDLPVAAAQKTTIVIVDESGRPVELGVPVLKPVADPIGDTTDGEARFSASATAESEAQSEMAAYRADTTEDASESTHEIRPEPAQAKAPATQAISPQEKPAPAKSKGITIYKKSAKPKPSPAARAIPAETEPEAAEPEEVESEEASPETVFTPRPPAKLERLQKILSRAGIASRRKAEEMIEAGRVIVNGQPITKLGAKADPARDHIRVDGKLLEGAERHRYFVLNKPRGFVTTVSDPEGRPTVMQFFEKMRERLYPVGRLDYLSEGLLLVTNDGELANQLTKAAGGVEKIYLVKVSGQPTEEELEMLRTGVPIERGQPGSPKVHTAAAQVRQVRQGDNPWYEVVLIEGRNRELRKMFSAIGHFVEKIRRVGYGPLVLDQEPGKLRELDPQELAALRLTAQGKLKPRRIKTAQLLPKEDERQPASRPSFSAPAPASKPFAKGSFAKRPFPGKSSDKPRWKPREQPYAGGREPERSPRPGFARPQGERPAARFSKPDARPDFRRPEGERFPSKPGFERPEGQKFPARPGFTRPPAKSFGRDGGARSGSRPYSRPDAAPRAGFGAPSERPAFKRHDDSKRRFDRAPDKPFGAAPGKSFESRPKRTFDGKPAGTYEKPSGKSFDSRPKRNFEGKSAGGFSRPAGKPPGKTWSKGPAKPWTGAAAKSFDAGPADRPRRVEGSAPAYRGKPSPRPASGARPSGGGRSASAGRARPASGGRSKPSFGSKPGGFKRSGPRLGPKSTAGKRPGRPKRG